MSDSRGGTIINATENESLEAVREEQYPTRIQPLPLPFTPITALETDDPRLKPRSDTYNKYHCMWSGETTTLSSNHLHKAWSTLKKNSQTHFLPSNTASKLV
ncbi:hypothetical protein ILYODFUR_036733 [Ilyodon furcidens]|uniref:Uncharacterized protein n=1 Tax=Ilyodon furcidens TaxID=33524 RepID=A0ABV0UM39_9TELE